MESIGASQIHHDRRRRLRLTAAIKQALRQLGNQLSLLNHHVGAHVDLKDVDLDCLDLVVQHGPLSPSLIATRAGLHPATLTGILDRLERAGWVARERDPADRRGVLIRARNRRNSELVHLYSGMNASMDALCARYTEQQLETIADFLQRTADAGRHASEQLAQA